MAEKLSITDKKIKEYIEDRNLSQKRINEYNLIFSEYKKVIKRILKKEDVNYTYLIKQAKKEQQKPFKDNKGKIMYIDIPERSIAEYLKAYKNYLTHETTNKQITIKNKISSIRTFYDDYEIQLPKNFKFDPQLPIRVKKGDIPDIEDVGKGVRVAKSLRDKAINVFVFSSGMRLSDVAPITMYDFLQSTEKYHNGSIENLLKKDPENIIPTWDFIPEKTKKKGNLCITFNTTECVEYVFEYLEERIEKELPIEDDTALFRSNVYPNFFDPNSLGKIFTRINKYHFQNKKDNLDKSFYRAHNLRKLFLSIARNKNSDANSKLDEESKIDIVSVLGGHKPPGATIKEVYEYADVDIFKKYYEGLLPFLSIRDNKSHNYKSDDVIKMEKQLEVERNARITAENRAINAESMAREANRKIDEFINNFHE